MTIERTEPLPLQVEYSVVIGLCQRDLKLNRPPTADEMVAWSRSKGHEIITLTLSQAQFMLDNPRNLFATD